MMNERNVKEDEDAKEKEVEEGKDEVEWKSCKFSVNSCCRSRTLRNGKTKRRKKLISGINKGRMRIRTKTARGVTGGAKEETSRSRTRCEMYWKRKKEKIKSWEWGKKEKRRMEIKEELKEEELEEKEVEDEKQKEMEEDGEEERSRLWSMTRRRRMRRWRKIRRGSGEEEAKKGQFEVGGWT